MHASDFRLQRILIVLLVVTAVSGCVRRTLRITTDPPGALIFLNDQEIGRSDVSTDFLWYGDYDLVIRKKGYQTVKTSWDVKPPWYQYIPIDFFAEVLWPGQIHDVHSKRVSLALKQLPSAEELVERASETRKRALDRHK